MIKPTDEEIEAAMDTEYGENDSPHTYAGFRDGAKWAIARMEEGFHSVEQFEKHYFPIKLTPAQKAAIRWPSRAECMTVTAIADEGLTAHEMATWAINHALKDLIDE